MKTLIKIVVMTTVLGLSSLYAHGGARHNHNVSAPVQEETSKNSIKKLAKQEVKRLAVAKKIDNNWLFIPISRMKKTQYNEWIISFKNSAIKDETKQTLYIFVSVHGDLTGANYTGR